jgi:hypothetical protein
MKSLSVVLLLMVVGLCGCQDQRVSMLEKQVTELEGKVKTIEEKQTQTADAASEKQAQFRDCVDGADDDFLSAVRSNGTKNRNGYAVDTRVMEQIERQKQTKLEECRLLYK